MKLFTKYEKIACHRAQLEVDAAISVAKDPGTKEFSRASILNFSYEKAYDVRYNYSALSLNRSLAELAIIVFKFLL